MRRNKKHKENSKARKLLYRSFEVSLSPEEQKELDAALRHSNLLRTEQQKITQLRGVMSGSATDSFAPFFTEKVMRRIYAEKEQKEVSEGFFDAFIWSFRRIALAGIIAVMFLAAYNILQTEKFSLQNMLAIPQLTLEETMELNEFTEKEIL